MENRLVSLIVVALAGTVMAETVTLKPDADASITGSDATAVEGKATLNFGSAPELVFKGSPNINYHSVVYLRFNLAPLAGKTVTAAKLRFSTLDGKHFPIEDLMIAHSSPTHHDSRFADLRMAATFDDLISGKDLLFEAGFDHPGGLEGASDGTGFGGPWTAEQESARVEAGQPSHPGWTARGGSVRMKGKASRRLAEPIQPESGSLWFGGWLQSTNSSRTATVRFGDVVISHNNGKPILLNHIPAKSGPASGMNLVIVRIDFAKSGNTVYLWVNPDLAAGEPKVEDADVSTVSVSQNKEVGSSLLALKPDAPGNDWKEDSITWRNAPGNLPDGLGDRLATGHLYHIFSKNLQEGRRGLTVEIEAPKLVWFLNRALPNSVTLVLTGRHDRTLSFASKEHPSLPGPELIVETAP